MSHFSPLDLLPDDPIVHLPILFAADPRPNKVNLGVGAYRDSDGFPMPLVSVVEAEKLLNAAPSSKEYLPIEGDPDFIDRNGELVFGKPFFAANRSRLFGAQTIGGTGALRIGGELLAKLSPKIVALPKPTWPNHQPTFEKSGLTTTTYRYYDPTAYRLDFDALCSDIAALPPGAAVLLHAGCHNPSGIDPTKEQWLKLSALLKERSLIPFFDLAYQGFSGTLDEDAWPVRYFAEQGNEMLVANSFAKNLGLYGERVGGLFLLASDPATLPKAASHIKQTIRNSYSSPPLHGMRVVKAILSTPSLYKGWEEELADMRLRLHEMRLTLKSGLDVAYPKKDWSFLLKQKGFFSYLGISKEQVGRLNKEFAIYMPASGRINVAGLNGHNMDYLIHAIASVLPP